MEKGRPAVFLDRDGTINVDYGYVYQPEKLEFIPGSIEGMKLLQAHGFLLIIVTNQSGIARGYFTEEQMNGFHKVMAEKLDSYGVKIDGIYFCPHLEGCTCRKPGVDLYYRAKRDFNIDFSKSYVIGDNFRDLSLCNIEPVEGYLLLPKSEKQYCTDEKWAEHVKICDNLLQAAQDIVGSRKEEL